MFSPEPRATKRTRPDGQQPRQGPDHQFHPLLPGQARDHAYQRNVHVGLQPAGLQQVSLVDLLVVEGSFGVLGPEVPVGAGVPDVEIDSVEDSDEVGGAEPKETVEPRAVFGRLDLAGIGGGNRRDGVGIEKRMLHEADSALSQMVLMEEVLVMTQGEIRKDV